MQTGAEDIERSFDDIARWQPAAVYTLTDGFTFAHAPLIARLALKHRVPSVFYFREAVEAGGLASYGPDFKAVPRDAGVFVDKILRGANPGHLPIEPPVVFNLVLNTRTAKVIGVTIPPSVMLRADHIIE